MALFRKKQTGQPELAAQPAEQGPQIKRLLSYQVANLQGIGARARQEDSFAVVNAFDVTEIKEKGLLFVVCDGMGGMKDGKLASETAVASIRSSFAVMDRSRDLAQQLKESVYLASQEILEYLKGDGGSTIVAGIIFREQLYYASVGDSCFYLKRDDCLYRLNREHNLCSQIYLESIRAGTMKPREGEESPEAAALTQFLGMDGMNDVDCSVRPFPLQQGDVLLACSDGVGGVLDDEEVLDALKLDNVQDMCARLEEKIAAHARKNQDNYTALAVKCLY